MLRVLVRLGCPHNNDPAFVINMNIVHHCRVYAGAVPGYADFFIWALLDTAKGFVPDMFKDQAILKQWSARVKGLPAVTNYLANRPRVRDVSKWKL